VRRLDLLTGFGLLVAGIVAGAINSVAGGGSLISFPSLVASGLPAIVANATNTAAIWPGSLSSAIAYAPDVRRDTRLLVTLLVPSLVGGFLGALVLVSTPPELFARVVPWLVLFATLVFASQGRLARWTRSHAAEGDHVGPVGRMVGFLLQLFVASYGGYFGAGIGILMLGSFSVVGLRDLHRMNGLKTVLATVINVVAFGFFALEGLIAWPVALVMGVGTVIGGYFGAHGAKRVPQERLRTGVVVVGLLVSAWLFWSQ
jgi:uncharacterized protein